MEALMITDVTSKVDLPANANHRSQTNAYPPNGQGDETVRGSDVRLTSQTDRVALEQAVGKVRASLQQSGSRLQIEVDPDIRRVIVKVLNGDSGEVIRQIPPQEVIDLAKNLSGSKGSLFQEHV
jgi:flagellar protein FlaG